MSPLARLCAAGQRQHSRAFALALALAVSLSAGAPLVGLPVAAQATKGRAAAKATDTRAILQDLDRYIPKALAEWNGAGVAVGIVKDDSLIYAKGFGVREIGKPDAVDDRTIFAIGSNSKFFTAVAAGMLADDGKLSLDDKVTKFLPWFQLYDPWVTREFTLRDAMSHRSGLGRAGDAVWYGTGYSRDEVIRRVRHLVPTTSFRTEFGYQNIMFITAGQAIGAAAGSSWDEVVQSRIFQPLGMTSSSTSVKQLTGVPNVASPHDLATGGAKPVAIPYRDIDNAGPAGSINSNVQDMARWMRFILASGSFGGRQLLKPATLLDLTSPHTVATRIVADSANPTRHFSMYGLGIGLSDLHGVKVIQHTGGIDGMLSYVAMIPERKLGVVVLTNVSGHNSMYGALGSRIVDALLGGPERDNSALALAEVNKAEQAMATAARTRMASRPTDTKPSRALGEYAGTYRDEMYGDLTVTLENGTLVARYGRAVELKLSHFSYDNFLGANTSSSLLAGDAVPVSFTVDPLGAVSSLTIENIGSFARVKAGGK